MEIGANNTSGQEFASVTRNASQRGVKETALPGLPPPGSTRTSTDLSYKPSPDLHEAGNPTAPPPKPPRAAAAAAAAAAKAATMTAASPTRTESFNAYDAEDTGEVTKPAAVQMLPCDTPAPRMRHSAGWEVQTDADGTNFYTHPATNDEWVPVEAEGGQVYYYEKNSRLSTWDLPDVAPMSQLPSQRPQSSICERPSGPIFCGTSSTINTIDLSAAQAKFGARKLPVSRSGDNLAASGLQDDNSKRAPRVNKVLITGPIENKITSTERRGRVYRTLYSTNGVLVPKKWLPSMLVLSGPMLYIYKDSRGQKASASLSGKPEVEASVTHLQVFPVDKNYTSRENVFLLKDLTDPNNIAEHLIDATSAELKRSWETALMYSQDLVNENRFHSGAFSTRPPPNVDQKIIVMLREFFRRRPPLESLRASGILRNEPVFGSNLLELCEKEQTNVPTFITRVICAVESRGLDAVGIYRMSGNAGVIQKLRNQVNHSEYTLNSVKWDIYELSDSLKLFLRELKEPLLSHALYNDLLEFNSTMANYSKEDNVERMREILSKLPDCCYSTTKLLFEHLNKVTTFSSLNHMNSKNLAIVIGPNIMWPDSPETDYARFSIASCGCTEFLIANYAAVFASN